MRIENDILYLKAFPYHSDVSPDSTQAIPLPAGMRAAKITYLGTDDERHELAPWRYGVVRGDMLVPSTGAGWPATRYTEKDDVVEIHLAKAEAGDEATAAKPHDSL